MVGVPVYELLHSIGGGLPILLMCCVLAPCPCGLINKLLTMIFFEDDVRACCGNLSINVCFWIFPNGFAHVVTGLSNLERSGIGWGDVLLFLR